MHAAEQETHQRVSGYPLHGRVAAPTAGRTPVENGMRLACSARRRAAPDICHFRPRRPLLLLDSNSEYVSWEYDNTIGLAGDSNTPGPAASSPRLSKSA